jgi:hypothetical protein
VVRFGHGGVELQDADGELLLGLRLRAWGLDAQRAPVGPGAPVLGACLTRAADPGCARPVEYRRPGLTEWWVGLGSGLEWGWTVDGPPSRGDELVLEVELVGAGPPVASAGALHLTDARGARWALSGLRAWDADGAVLPASMTATADGVEVRVQVQGARWPVVVDPVLDTASTTLHGAHTGDWFGSSVAILGDVNGDGYDDLAIGAPSTDADGVSPGRAPTTSSGRPWPASATSTPTGTTTSWCRRPASALATGGPWAAPTCTPGRRRASHRSPPR